MRRSFAFLLVAAAALAVACGQPAPSGDDTIDERPAIPAPPANGAQLIGPEEIIPAGGDRQICWVPDFHQGEDKLLAAADAIQGSSGHHVLVFASLIPRKAGDVFDCTDASTMITMTLVMVPHTNVSSFDILPAGMVVRLKADQQVVIQSHYVNVNTHPIKIRDVVNLTYADPAQNLPEASYFAANVNDLDVPPGQHTVTSTCTMPNDVAALSVFGHMHEWGRSYKLETVDDAGAATEIYSVPEWTAVYRDTPPVTRFDPSSPKLFPSGQTMRITCEFNNDTGDDLKFPHEMCSFIGAYSPALPDGLIVCDTDAGSEIVN